MPRYVALFGSINVGGNRLTMAGAYVERRLGRKGTARNLRSMRRILAKMDES